MEIKRILRLTSEEAQVLKLAADTLNSIGAAVWDQKAVDEIDPMAKEEIRNIAYKVQYVMNGPSGMSENQEG